MRTALVVVHPKNLLILVYLNTSVERQPQILFTTGQQYVVDSIDPGPSKILLPGMPPLIVPLSGANEPVVPGHPAFGRIVPSGRTQTNTELLVGGPMLKSAS